MRGETNHPATPRESQRSTIHAQNGSLGNHWGQEEVRAAPAQINAKVHGGPARRRVKSDRPQRTTEMTVKKSFHAREALAVALTRDDSSAALRLEQFDGVMSTPAWAPKPQDECHRGRWT